MISGIAPSSGRIRFEYKIAILYFIIGFVWIYFSDTFFNRFIENRQLLIELQITKGILYVFIDWAFLEPFIRNIQGVYINCGAVSRHGCRNSLNFLFA